MLKPCCQKMLKELCKMDQNKSLRRRALTIAVKGSNTFLIQVQITCEREVFEQKYPTVANLCNINYFKFGNLKFKVFNLANARKCKLMYSQRCLFDLRTIFVDFYRPLSLL